MRILHVIPQFPFFGGGTIVGGHASSLLTLARSQAQAGHYVTILSFTAGCTTEPRRVEPNLELVSVFRRGNPGSICFGLSFMCAARAWVATRRDQYDVVHAHSGFADYIPVSQAIRRKIALPTLHSVYCPVPAGSGRWNAPVIRQIITSAASRLEGFTAISQNVADSLRSMGISRPDLRVVRPPVDLERFSPGEEPHVRESLGIAPGELAVLYVGNASEQKNLSGLLHAFAEVRRVRPNAKLVITTELKQSSTDERLSLLRNKMGSLGLEASVVQLGIVRDMPGLMRACDVLVAPFLDSFGPSDYFMAVLEAMATGKPTIVSAVGGMPEVITPESGRLVDPRRKGEIARALGEVLGDRSLREALGRAARETLVRSFQPRAIVAQYDDLYASILERGDDRLIASRAQWSGTGIPR